MTKPNENKKGYKHTPDGKVPNDWATLLLNKGVELLSGQHILAENCNEIGKGIQYLTGPADFLDDVFHSTKFTDHPKTICEKNDILVTVKGSGAGKVILADKRYCISRQLMAVRSKKWNTRFLYYYLKLQETKFSRNSAGLIPGITRDDLLNELVPLPSLPEQKAIANILSTWDKAIETSRRIIAQKETRRIALMRRLLSGRKRLPGFTEKWKIKSLEEVLIPISRAVVKPDKSFLALGIRSHGKGTFLKEEFDPTKIDMDTLYTVKENDLIVNITFAWEGAIAIAGSRDDGALVSHRFPMFTFNHNEGIVDYFRYIILQPRFKYMLGLISPGGAGRNRVLSKGDFLKLELKLPNTEEQAAIAKVLRTADKELHLLKQKLESLKEQKRGLMQKLFTGQLIVNV